MNRGVAVAHSLYLELRARHLEVWLEEDAWRAGGVLDYGVVVDGLQSLSVAQVNSVTRRILDNENELVRLLADMQDPDLCAIRREGNCG